MQQPQCNVGTTPAPSYRPTRRGGGGGSPHTGPAEIIPFPIVARVRFIERMMDMVTSRRNPESYLADAFNKQEDAMRRKGIAQHIIDSELASLERALASRLMARGFEVVF